MKKFETVRMPVADLAALKHRCAWKGCREAVEIEERPPVGWRWLAIWTGKAGLPPWAGRMDRDAVLCPAHVRQLDGLLEDIGQAMNRPEGRA